MPVAGHRRGRAEPTLEVDGGGAEAGPRGSERKRLAGLRRGAVAEIPIGGKASPVLVAAVEEIEQHGAAHERHANVPDREATPALAQKSLNARASVQAEGRTAGQHHGVDALGGAVRFEQVGFPRARRAAAHVDGGDRGLLEDNDGYAGGETRVVGVSDQNAGDVGDEIALRHWASLAPRLGLHRSTVTAASLWGQITAPSHPSETGIGGLRKDANAPHLGAWSPTSPSSPRSLPAL